MKNATETEKSILHRGDGSWGTVLTGKTYNRMRVIVEIIRFGWWLYKELSAGRRKKRQQERRKTPPTVKPAG
jgi:hypothetical protein